MTSEVKMPVAAYVTNDEEGCHSMLFFDPQEAAKYTDETDPPQALVLQSDALAAMEAARVEARAKALEEAERAVECLDRPGRDWMPDSLLDRILKEAAARVSSLAKEAP